MKNMYIRKTVAITVECPKCGYTWRPRIEPSKIKSCPECKQRIAQYLKKAKP